jgi:general stress protein 26
MDPMTPETLLEVAGDVMEEAEFCFLITLDESGRANARLMQPFGPEADMTVWLGANPESRKVAEILEDDRVTLAYGHGEKAAYVTLIGTAQIQSDAASKQRYWRDSFHEFWPAGPGDSSYIVIKFVPSRVELVDMERQVAPEPFGLRPAVVVREGDGWQLEA